MNIREHRVQKERKKTHQSLERALRILLNYLPHNRELTASEISKKLGLSKSTTGRILSVLRHYGFIQQNRDNKKFSLGPAIADLGVALRRSINSNLGLLAKPVLDDLRDRLGETVVLEIPTPQRTVLVYVAEGVGPITIKGMVGDRHHYHTSAGGKAMLAFMDPGFRESILSKELPALTPRSKTSRDDIEAELEEIRRVGFSFDRQENNVGIQALATPVFDNEGKPVAAVVVAGPAQSVHWNKRHVIVPSLKEASEAISERLFNKSGVVPLSQRQEGVAIKGRYLRSTQK